MSQEQARTTVLMIDDEGSARKMVTLLLEREGYRVITAPDGKEGLVQAKVEQPAVILLDILMPSMDGYETLKRLRADTDTKEIPVIMVTAKSTEHDIMASYQRGAIFHVEKPYETQDLLRKIQGAVALNKGQSSSNPPPQTS